MALNAFQVKFGTNLEVEYEMAKVETTLVESVERHYIEALKYLSTLQKRVREIK